MKQKEMEKMIIEDVELNLPAFAEAVKSAGVNEKKEIIMTQGAFNIMPTETALLGRAIKYAGMYKVNIRIIS